MEKRVTSTLTGEARLLCLEDFLSSCTDGNGRLLNLIDSIEVKTSLGAFQIVIEVEQKVKGDMEANQETKTIVEDMNTITTGEVARTPALM
ncbi:hypothetical protein HAX54_033234 [Datura stramonium]|uniref:Uncharacterized protein n=1 Tax=Datura stramonium TaxID=4076 RepID=A0ABS8SD46_DATST|nr:hypothetical protein [Datura stramonium]